MEIEYLSLSEDNKRFLDNYCPKDDMVTSYAEIKEIRKQLGIGTTLDKSQMTPLRNSVVRFYSDKMKPYDGKGDKESTDKIWKLMQSLQSVTAVIDAVIYSI